ncbi:MAG: hypothetical protein R3A13_00285 [Bdellovibrionota bacterium]
MDYLLLGAVIETAKKGSRVFKAILELKEEVENISNEAGSRGQSIRVFFNHLFQNPVQPNKLTFGELSNRNIRRLISEFEAGFLLEVTGQKRKSGLLSLRDISTYSRLRKVK